MRTAIDSSVLLDVLVDDPAHAAASERALRRVTAEGSLIISECVLAEIAPAFSEQSDIEAFLMDWKLEFVASTRHSALLAGEMFRAYLRRRKSRGTKRVVADFLIGAHAVVAADRLLTRDRGYYRDHFEGLSLLQP